MSDDLASVDGFPEPAATDARRAVVDAARMDGVTAQRGAYQARRTYVDLGNAFRSADNVNVVKLSFRVGYGGDTVGVYPVIPFHILRGDWSHPTPDDHERGDDVLPEDDYSVDDIFVDSKSLPGGAFRDDE